MEISPKPGGLPNFFYDIIVFLIPTLLFGIGLVLGMGWELKVLAYVSSVKIEGWPSFWIIMAAILASYEYGRLAETFSDIIVAKPLRFLHKKKIFLKNKDFAKDLRDDTVPLNLNSVKIGSRSGSKWAIYVFALVFAPALGTDLLKRYAWEKLARSSAFSCAMLATISLCCAWKMVFSGKVTLLDTWQFGGINYTLAALISYIILCADYYKRNAWNHDLLATVVPILVRAAKTPSEASEESSGDHHSTS